MNKQACRIHIKRAKKFKKKRKRKRTQERRKQERRKQERKGESEKGESEKARKREREKGSMHTNFEMVSRTTLRNSSNTDKVQLHC